jgi:hypothetical protein
MARGGEEGSDAAPRLVQQRGRTGSASRRLEALWRRYAGLRSGIGVILGREARRYTSRGVRGEAPHIAAETTTLTIPCLACRYDLAATARTGVCPECGADAEESLRAAEEAARRSPHFAASLAQVIAFGTSAVAAMVLVGHATIDSVATLLFFGAFLAAVVSPPLGVGAIAWRWRSRRAASRALLVASVLLAVVYAAVLIEAFVVAGSSTAALGILVLPVIGFPVLVGAAIAALVILRHPP